MAEKVVIGSKLPHGLAISIPESEDKITIKGLNSSKIIGADHVTTEIDAQFWARWKELHKGYKPLESGAIFEAKTANDAAAKAKEFAKRRTGLEPMEKDGDPRAAGAVVKPLTAE